MPEVLVPQSRNVRVQFPPASAVDDHYTYWGTQQDVDLKHTLRTASTDDNVEVFPIIVELTGVGK